MMKTLNGQLEVLVEELMTVLDEDIVQINLTLQRLNELRAMVIKRDEDELKILLEMIRVEGNAYAKVETRRQQIRAALAAMVGCGFEQMNMTRICESIQGDQKVRLETKQQELTGLVTMLKQEHVSTGMLLRECYRMNNMLLKGMFGNKAESTTYDRSGGSSWQSQRELMNVRF